MLKNFAYKTFWARALQYASCVFRSNRAEITKKYPLQHQFPFSSTFTHTDKSIGPPLCSILCHLIAKQSIQYTHTFLPIVVWYNMAYDLFFFFACVSLLIVIQKYKCIYTHILFVNYDEHKRFMHINICTDMSSAVAAAALLSTSYQTSFICLLCLMFVFLPGLFIFLYALQAWHLFVDISSE